MLNFIYISMYDWFFRDGKPRQPNSMYSSQERAGYVLSFGLIIWINVVEYWFSSYIYGAYYRIIPEYLIIIAGIISYLMIYLFYVKSNKFKDIYEKYKIKFGPNNLMCQLITIFFVIFSPMTVVILIVLAKHKLI